MGLNEILLVVAALIPAIVLCVYVYKKDKVEKEPLGILLLLLFLGVMICFPAIYLELILKAVIDGVFGISALGGSLNYITYTIYQFISCTVGVALVEEGLKWLVLFLVSRKTKHFNSLFDGLIYAIFVSLGFAAYENVLYVLQNGWMNAVMRAVLSVPGHMFFAVIMGCYFTRYYTTKLARETEFGYRRKGMLPANRPPFSETRDLVLSILMPTLCHGFYNFCLNMGSPMYLLAVLALVVCLYIFCFRHIKSTSNQDTHILLCVLKLMESKYPGFSNMVTQEMHQTTPVPTTNIRFAGIYAKTPGIVRLVAPVKQPLNPGATIATIRTALGQELPIVTNIACQIEKYDILDGSFVGENKLLGVMKYTI